MVCRACARAKRVPRDLAPSIRPGFMGHPCMRLTAQSKRSSLHARQCANRNRAGKQSGLAAIKGDKTLMRPQGCCSTEGTMRLTNFRFERDRCSAGSQWDIIDVADWRPATDLARSGSSWSHRLLSSRQLLRRASSTSYRLLIAARPVLCRARFSVGACGMEARSLGLGVSLMQGCHEASADGPARSAEVLASLYAQAGNMSKPFYGQVGNGLGITAPRAFGSWCGPDFQALARPFSTSRKSEARRRRKPT